MSIAIGLIAALLISGAIEGFVTGHVHTTWLRIGIGVVAETVFLTYVIVLGRRATAEGDTGDATLRPALAPMTG
jgi:hypothetical protein